MARIRTIKPEFFTSEQIVECSTIARLLFVGMWVFSDDGGVHPASAKRLKMEVFPADDITSEEVAKLVQEMIDAGLVELYEVDGESFWRVKGWHHQKIENPTYRFPRSKEFGDISSTRRREVAETSSTPRRGNGRESKGKEKKGARATFVKPTLQEVTDYCKAKGYDIDPLQFCAHYESNGWRVGRNPMKSWRASVVTWVKRRPEFQNGQRDNQDTSNRGNKFR